MYRLYEVDPDADTLLIVPHLTEPFAPWDRDEQQQQQQHLQQASSTITSSNTSSLSPPASPTGRPPITPSHDADAYSSVYAGILRGTARPTNIYARIASSPSLSPTPSPPRPETRIKVSSRHLRLASRPFRDRFRHLDRVDDAAATARSDDGRVHVALPGRGPHDPAAAILVMDMLHGRGRKVPRAVGLETLARVAVVVDALRALEAVEAYADRWFDALLPPPPSGRGGSPAVGGDEYGRDLVLWLYASYVFRRADVFQRVTRTAVLRSDGPVRSLGLNIREGIIREIDDQRQRLVRKALELVKDTIDALQEDKSPCELGCGTFLLGALVKALRRRKLLWPQPEKPYSGISLAGITEAVEEAQAQVAQFIPGLSLGAPASAQKSRTRKSRNAQPGQALTPDSSPEQVAASDVHECGAKTDLTEKLDGLAAGVEGLQLEGKLGFCLY